MRRLARVIASALADALDGVQRRQDDDRLPPQVLDHGLGQHDALVGLLASSVSCVDGLPVVAHGERKPKPGLQLDQVLAPGCSRCPYLPQLSIADLGWSATSFRDTGRGTAVHQRPG